MDRKGYGGLRYVRTYVLGVCSYVHTVWAINIRTRTYVCMYIHTVCVHKNYLTD